MSGRFISLSPKSECGELRSQSDKKYNRMRAYEECMYGDMVA